MADDFYQKPFTDETKLKLELFRGYIREWIPVFFTQYKLGKKNFSRINIFDFFAGSGRDAMGSLGSPLIVIDELKRYCETQARLRNSDVKVHLFLYDSDESKIRQLRASVSEVACDQGCCAVHIEVKLFYQALTDSIPILKDLGAANLVIMDQFGIKDVTPDIIKRLAQIETTDILFFIPSSYIKRFKENQEFLQWLDLESSSLEGIEHGQIHRYICDHFKAKIPLSVEYFMAPFSIKKGGNIHGIIFGSRCLLGLEKFQKVCWSLDPATGEANYNIDNDPFRNGQLSFFDEDNVMTKEREFENSLRDKLTERALDNHELYRFVLESGFALSRAHGILSHLQKEGILAVILIENRRPARKGSFYLSWDNYFKSPPKVVFRIQGS